MGRPRKVQTPGVTAPVDQQIVEPVGVTIQKSFERVKQLEHEAAVDSSEKQAAQDPDRPKRWVLKEDGWHHE